MSDVRAVDIGVGHEDDLVVAQLLDVEVLVDPGAQRGDQRLDLVVPQHLVDPGLLDIQDLAPYRQDRLVLRVPSLLGGATGRVTLDDEDLALLGVGRLAVGELPRQTATTEQTLAVAGQVAALRAAMRRAASIAWDDQRPSAGFSSNQAPSLSLTARWTSPSPRCCRAWSWSPSNCGSASLTR